MCNEIALLTAAARKKKFCLLVTTGKNFFHVVTRNGKEFVSCRLLLSANKISLQQK